MHPHALAGQLRELGVVSGGALLVHTSYRAIRPIEGGPLGLITALREALGPDGTLVMPSWSDHDDEPFDPARSRTAPDLGVLPHLFWQQPGVRRAVHVHAFAAAGPRAAEILRDPLPLPPHIPESPVGRLHDLDGQVLLLGVKHDANTSLHLAEVLADVPYRLPKYITVMRGGRRERVEYGENDHCGAGFLQVEEWMSAAGAQSVGTVGAGTARLMRSRDLVRIVVERLRADPLTFLHPATAGCEECDQARAGLQG